MPITAFPFRTRIRLVPAYRWRWAMLASNGRGPGTDIHGVLRRSRHFTTLLTPCLMTPLSTNRRSRNAIERSAGGNWQDDVDTQTAARHRRGVGGLLSELLLECC